MAGLGAGGLAFSSATSAINWEPLGGGGSQQTLSEVLAEGNSAGSYSIDLSGNSLTDTSQGFLDLTGDGNDLRLATGQAIEDGSGVDRIRLQTGQTEILNQNGKEALELAGGNVHRLSAYSTTPLDIYDDEGGFTAVQYTTASSAPGRLELTNAFIDMASSGNAGRIEWPTQGGGTSSKLRQDSNGEIEAGDDDGNFTVLT